MMHIGLAPYALGAAGLSLALHKLRIRLQLSRAKHPSLRGHARIARRVARLVPFYEYGEARFFASDGAPPEIAAQRRAALARLSELYRQRFAATDGLTAE